MDWRCCLETFNGASAYKLEFFSPVHSVVTLKRQLHHWWPKCVSQHWEGDDGMIGRIQPDGRITRVAAHRLGSIADGHHGKVSNLPGSMTTSWDFSFEKDFDKADSHFPEVISWLESMKTDGAGRESSHTRFRSEDASDDQLRILTECVVSLIVRSPMSRDAFANFSSRLGLPISKAERDVVVGVNMLGKQRKMSDSINCSGKFAVLFTDNREFIYGDGCFNNLSGYVDPPYSPKLLVPITPNLSVIVYRPFSYIVEPRLSSIDLTRDEVDQCNHAIQVYSRAEIFFRSEIPHLDPAFTCAERRKYARPDNPIDSFIGTIPGISGQKTYY